MNAEIIRTVLTAMQTAISVLRSIIYVENTLFMSKSPTFYTDLSKICSFIGRSKEIGSPSP
jgi:hypothetical protein